MNDQPKHIRKTKTIIKQTNMKIDKEKETKHNKKINYVRIIYKYIYIYIHTHLFVYVFVYMCMYVYKYM